MLPEYFATKMKTALLLQTTPEEQCIEMIIRSRKGGKFHTAEIEKVYNQLKPVKPNQLLGEWKSRIFNTGSKYGAVLKSLKVAGKRFNSMDDVEPAIIYNDRGERVSSDFWGRAKIQSLSHRGLVTAALVYDRAPVYDYYRYVNKDTVIGVMDYDGQGCTMDGNDDTVYFYLTRLNAVPKYFEARL